MRETAVAVLAAEFNQPIVDAMIESAADEVAKLGARIVRTVRVPGCYDTVLIADHLLTLPDVDALVVLGFIERGETLHGEVMGHVIFRALVDSELRHRKAVGLGVIGPGAIEAQALVRQDAAARAAVRSAVRIHQALTSLSAEAGR